MSSYSKFLIPICFAAILLGCESRTDQADGGGVLLSVSDFDGLPVQVSVNDTAIFGGGLVQIEDLTVQNVIKDPTGASSALMDVEIRSYEVTFSRADNGTRLPPTLVRGLFGTAPANGTFTVTGLPVMTIEQLANQPLSDLLFQNGGVDRETGSNVIILNLFLRFFGRTLSGDAVESAPAAFTIEFVP
jgi:hypothetical protein